MAHPRDWLKTPTRFRRWLEAKRPEEVVGPHAGAADGFEHSCELERFLRAAGVEWPCIGVDAAPGGWSVAWGSPQERMPLPAWARRYCESPRANRDGLTAAGALRALREAIGR